MDLTLTQPRRGEHWLFQSPSKRIHCYTFPGEDNNTFGAFSVKGNVFTPNMLFLVAFAWGRGEFSDLLLTFPLLGLMKNNDGLMNKDNKLY